jgi:hypothetical protein
MNGYRFCVFECKQAATGLVSLTGDALATTKKPCWNLLYDAPFNPGDEEETAQAFSACHVWLDQNALKTSEYVITEMYFYDGLTEAVPGALPKNS